MKKVLACTLGLFSSAAMAQGFNVDLLLDEDKDVAPVMSLPYNWSDSLYSQINFRSTAIANNGTSTILAKSNTVIDEQYTRFDLIGYKSKSKGSAFSVAAGVEFVNIERNEFGFGSVSGSPLTIDNNIDIEATRFLIAGSYQWDHDLFSVVASANVAPVGNLDVEQDTNIDYTTQISTDASSSDSMSLSYGIGLDLMIPTGTNFDIALDLEYEFLPLEYDLDVANGTLTGYETAKIEQDHTSLRMGAKVLLPKTGTLGRPTIGFTRERVNVEEGGSDSIDVTYYFAVGVSKNF